MINTAFVLTIILDFVKWDMTRLVKSNKIMLYGCIVVTNTKQSMSAPSEESKRLADNTSFPIPFSKQDLIHIINRLPVGFHSCKGKYYLSGLDF